MKKLLALALLLGLFIPAAALAEDISFNKASVAELEAGLAGLIDADLAKAIVDYRDKNGPFKKPDDLLKVPGMRPVVFNSIDPVAKDGDVVFVDEIPTGMHSY